MTAALRFEQVSKRFGRRYALDQCDWVVPEGTCYGLVGHNGAGKTTAMAVTTGLLRPQQGQIDLLGVGPFDVARHGGRVALLPQDALLPSDRNALDVLQFYARLQGLTARAARSQAAELLERVHLADRARNPLRTLSHGMRKRVMIAQCFLGQPELVLLDEPLSGLDPYEVAHMRALLKEKGAGITLIISSHNLHELELCCDYIGFMRNGRCTRSGPLDTIMGNRQAVTYMVDQAPSHEWIESTAKEGEFTLRYDAKDNALICEYPADAFTPASLNARLLPQLLKAGLGIIAIQQGQRLEQAYLSGQDNSSAFTSSH